MEYNKLVRDKIPRIIKEDGKTPITHIADEKEFRLKLKEKFKEEVDEFLEDTNIDEMVDVFEVFMLINTLNGWDLGKIIELQDKKRKERGGFDKKIILEKIE